MIKTDELMSGVAKRKEIIFLKRLKRKDKNEGEF